MTLNDIKVHIRYKLGDEIDDDASCDSEFMIPAMDRVGQAIRKAYHWVSPTETCYLVIDNAGGYGTSEAKEKYVAMLEKVYNITTIFQIPRSPYTNVLDLGVWMSLQDAVEREHYLKRCNANALVNSVSKTWKDGHLNHSITKIFFRLKPVLCNKIEANGANDLVESKRGLKHKNIKLEDAIRKTKKQNKTETVDLLEDMVVCEGDEDELSDMGHKLVEM